MSHHRSGRERPEHHDLERSSTRVVVSECACPEVLLRWRVDLVPNDVAWEGANPAKGLAVLAFGDRWLRIDQGHPPRATTTLPVHVTGPDSLRLRLLAVWNVPRYARRWCDPPPEPLGSAIERLTTFLTAPVPTVVAGDFGMALVKRPRSGKPGPSRLGQRLADLGFVSAYHHTRGVALGAEREPTFCRYRRLPGSHHTDFAMVDRRTLPRLRRVRIGRAERWIGASDHLPLLVDLALDHGGGRSEGPASHSPWSE